MSVRETIEHKLTTALNPSRLVVVDESRRHAGHAGMRPEEIERMVRFDVTWQRPTWPLGHMGGFDPDKVRDPFHVFTEEVWQRPPPRPSAHSPEQAALQVMQLQAPLTVEALKARYKELCKLHHPDANGGDKDAEERFKRIGQAYKVLMESLHS